MSGTWREELVGSVSMTSGTAVTTSGTFELGPYVNIGVSFGTLNTGTVSANVSADNVTYVACKGSANENVSIYGGTGPAAVYVPELAPYKYVQFVAATQAAARTFTIHCKS